MEERTLKLRDHTLVFGERPLIMGVLNVTPDSFSDGGLFADAEKAVEKAREMAARGADIIDVGGESSRPGAEPVSAEEEIKRVVPVIKELRRSLDVTISVDTWKSAVAREALLAGAEIINDITALAGDAEMARVVAEFGAGVILMHMRGAPRTMQDAPEYGDVTAEVYSFLAGAVERAVRAGISPERIIVDPGIGFGKTAAHNLRLLKDLEKFQALGKPVLVGTSRKAFIGSITDKDVRDRAYGTASSVAIAIMNGADAVRVHDVGAMRDAALVADAVRRA